MGELVKLAIAVLGPEPGTTLLMFVSLFTLTCVSIGAYWKEKKKGEAVADERLREAREDTEQVLMALKDAAATISDYKVTCDALKTSIEVSSKAIDRCHAYRGSPR